MIALGNHVYVIPAAVLACCLSQGVAASPLDCDSAVGDDRYMAEQCTSQELDQAIAAHTKTSQALSQRLSAEDARTLQALELARETYHQQYCSLVMDLAAANNAAWSLTWKDIAQDACRADMLTQHQARLDALLDVATQKQRQHDGVALQAADMVDEKQASGAGRVSASSVADWGQTRRSGGPALGRR